VDVLSGQQRTSSPGDAFPGPGLDENGVDSGVVQQLIGGVEQSDAGIFLPVMPCLSHLRIWLVDSRELYVELFQQGPGGVGHALGGVGVCDAYLTKAESVRHGRASSLK